MEMIPKAVVAGFLQGQFAGTGAANVLLPVPTVTRDTINRIWSEVVRENPYQSLQFDPTGSGGIFIGEGGAEDVVIIQPPLVQVRALVASDPRGIAGAAQKMGSIFKIALHHLSGSPPVNLGVKIIYHAPAPGHTAVDFLRTELVKGDEDLRTLAGNMDCEASLKVVLKGPDRIYTLLVEPLQSDPSNLFLDLDAQFPGTVDVGDIEQGILSVNEFLTTQVKGFIENRAKEWGA